MLRSVVFDLDGTLWQPDAVVLPAYARTFAQLGLPLPPESVLLETLGHPFDVIWRKILPDAVPEVVAGAHEIMLAAEKHYLTTLCIQPFPGVGEVLADLAAGGVRSHILSNCQTDYLELVPDRLGIGHFFTARYCAETFPGLSKAEIVRAVEPPIAVPAAFVGDRFHDIEAGKANGFVTIGCTFGYGELDELIEADHLAHSFTQVGEILRCLVRGGR